MNRPDEPFYHNKCAYVELFPDHIHNPGDKDCGVCMSLQATSICRRCKKEYALDYTAEQLYGDELRPVKDDCGCGGNWKSGHGYPM